MNNKIHQEYINDNEHSETQDVTQDAKANKKCRLSTNIFSILVGLLSIIVMIYSFRVFLEEVSHNLSNDEQKLTAFARQSEVIEGKTETVECSPKYLAEKDLYEGCFPEQCKRYVTDKLVTLNEADALLKIIRKALEVVGRSSGSATTINLNTGLMGVNDGFINIYEEVYAKDLFTEPEFNFLKALKEKMKHAAAKLFGVDPDKIYLTDPFFLTEQNSRDPVTKVDEYWKPHADKVAFKAFHYTTIIYLADYGVDFESGRLVFVGTDVNKTVEPRKARVVMFTSGLENMHRIERLTAGRRYTLFVPFTCDKAYAIEDPSVKKYQKQSPKPQVKS